MRGGNDPHDASEPGEERLSQKLHQLADSVGGTPPMSGAELRALAGRRLGRLLVAVPAAAVAGLLVGATAFAVTGGFATEPRHTAPTSDTSPTASAPRASGPTHSSAPAVPDRPPAVPGPAATASRPRTVPHGAARPTPAGPTGVAACTAARAGETLVRIHELSTLSTLTAPATKATAPMLSVVPLSCTRGLLRPSGPLQQLEASPDAVVTTTTPLSNGSASTLSTLQELATGLSSHPDQVFTVRRDTSGRVTRLDEVYLP